MKIFPLKLMSNFDKFQNLMKIMDKTEHVHVSKVSDLNEYGVKVDIDTRYYANEHLLTRLISKCKPEIKEIMEKLKRIHCEKSSIH